MIHTEQSQLVHQVIFGPKFITLVSTIEVTADCESHVIYISRGRQIIDVRELR